MTLEQFQTPVYTSTTVHSYSSSCPPFPPSPAHQIKHHHPLPPTSCSITSHRDPQHEIHHHRGQQHYRQHRWPKSIVKPALTPLSYTLRTPMVCEQGVDHGAHGNEGEQTRADATDVVAEVEQTDGESAQDDGEVKP